jgi:hypothetical protein
VAGIISQRGLEKVRADKELLIQTVERSQSKGKYCLRLGPNLHRRSR